MLELGSRACAQPVAPPRQTLQGRLDHEHDEREEVVCEEARACWWPGVWVCGGTGYLAPEALRACDGCLVGAGLCMPLDITNNVELSWALVGRIGFIRRAALPLSRPLCHSGHCGAVSHVGHMRRQCSLVVPPTSRRGLTGWNMGPKSDWGGLHYAAKSLDLVPGALARPRGGSGNHGGCFVSPNRS